MSDTICRYGSSTYQHGPLNNRVYLMRVTSKEIPEIFDIIEELALTSKYAKIVAKVPVSLSGDFLQRKYQKEALIPRFFHGKEDCVFMSRFLSYRNGKIPIPDNSMYAIRGRGPVVNRTPVLPEGYRSQPCKESDVHALSALFSGVYETYPFPIYNPDFLLAMMREGTRYHGIWFGDTIVAASSAEVDANEMNAEMTDFATLPAHRGLGLGRYLLSSMEQDLEARDIITIYTIARALSRQVNRLFFGAGYSYGGFLFRNTQICGSCESMNVWYRHLI